MLKNYLCVSYEQLYFCQLSVLYTHVLGTTESSNLTVCTDIGYKAIILTVKAFAGMSS